MPSSVKEMLAEANALVPRLDPAEVRNRMSRGDVLIVDVRDAPELASGGKLKGMAQKVFHVALDDMGIVESIHLTAFHWVVDDLYKRISL